MQSELVILVHGTFAGRADDAGEAWWQVESDTWKGLKSRLPKNARLADEGEVFHWSGENSERARIKAARELLARLSALEATGRPYHLIGHSHGGSVIWHTLRIATAEKKELQLLRSWSTVGTPFLNHRTRGAFNLANLVNMAAALVLLEPAYLTFSSLVQVSVAPFLGLTKAVDSKVDLMPGQVSWFRTPVLKALELLGTPVTVVEHGVRIGEFDSTAGDSFYEFLVTHPLGWLMLTLAVVVVYVYLNLGLFFLGPVIESIRLRAEKRHEQEVIGKYQDRWLGIWSSDDEAINGLRATLHLSVTFVPQMAPRERILFSDNLYLLSRPYYWVFAPIFNRVLHPILDRVVRSYVVKTAQGNNRPAAEVVEVSPTPGGLPADALPSLPTALNEQIVQSSDRYAEQLAPKLRRLIAAPSFVSGLEEFGGTISGHELVHTSYFDHAEILDLLAMNICWGEGQRRAIDCHEGDHLQHVAWFRNFKRVLGAPVAIQQRVIRSPNQSPIRIAERQIVRPRRAAPLRRVA